MPSKKKYNIKILLILLYASYSVLFYILIYFSADKITEFINSKFLNSITLLDTVGVNSTLILMLSFTANNLIIAILVKILIFTDEDTRNKWLKNNRPKHVILFNIALLSVIVGALTIAIPSWHQLKNGRNANAYVDRQSCMTNHGGGRNPGLYQKCNVLVYLDDGERFTEKYHSFFEFRRSSEIKSSEFRVYVDNNHKKIKLFSINDTIFSLSIILLFFPILILSSFTAFKFR